MWSPLTLQPKSPTLAEAALSAETPGLLSLQFQESHQVLLPLPVRGGFRIKPQATLFWESAEIILQKQGQTLTVCRAINPAESLWLLADTQQVGEATNYALLSGAESPSVNTQGNKATLPLYLHLPQTEESRKGMGFTNVHCICFFPSASPFLHSAFFELV